MPFLMIRNDITKLEYVDAIVNPANPMLLEGSGTSRAIYQAAGEKELAEACEKIGYCDIGKAIITPAFHLMEKGVKYIVHAVVPAFDDGCSNEDEMLAGAYRESMLLAEKQGCESIAFPLLAAGNMGYPKEKAMRVAQQTIHDFIYEHELMVYLVLYDNQAVKASRKWIPELQQYIDDHYVEEKNEDIPGDIYGNILRDRLEERRAARKNILLDSVDSFCEDGSQEINFSRQIEKSVSLESSIPAPKEKFWTKAAPSKRSLKDLLNRKPETFHEMFLRLVESSKYTAPELQLRSNMSKSTFSKIKVNPDYLPKKGTILSLAIGLELTLDETVDLLAKAGYALSECSKTDVIVQFYIENEEYDIFEINDELFDCNEPCLGQKMD